MVITSGERTAQPMKRARTGFTIRATKNGEVHETSGLSIENVFEGERDNCRNLISEGGVEFRAQSGKRFFLRFTQFSFVL
jgi:hypothetical protein